jgi:hypothetical protein
MYSLDGSVEHWTSQKLRGKEVNIRGSLHTHLKCNGPEMLARSKVLSQS